MHDLPRARDDALLVRVEQRIRQPVADADEPQRRRAREQRRQRQSGAPGQTSGGAAPTSSVTLPAATTTASIPARSSSSTSVALDAGEIGDRELARRDVGQQLEHPLVRGLIVVGVARREQEELRVDALERLLELFRVLDVDDRLEAERRRLRLRRARGRRRRGAAPRSAGRRPLRSSEPPRADRGTPENGQRDGLAQTRKLRSRRSAPRRAVPPRPGPTRGRRRGRSRRFRRPRRSPG